MRIYFHLYKKCTLIIFVVSVLVKSQQFYELSPIELLKLALDVLFIDKGDVEDSDVNFYISTRNNSKSPELISKERDDQVDVNKLSKFIVHGWIENYKIGWYEAMKDEFLKWKDVNVIYVDYTRIAKAYYYTSAENCPILGKFIGGYMVDKKFPLENLHLIGHSLGSHVAACAAKYIKISTGSKIKRLTALDPAGPYFRISLVPEEEKLTSNDAEIVDVLHTDGKQLGIHSPLGTLDIYFNGGLRMQPGCNDGEFSWNYHEYLKNTLCSHTRSHRYFTQSINNAEIICKKCMSLEDVTSNNCSEIDVYRIVHQEISENMKGICVVSTGSSPPYFDTKS